MSDIGSGMSGMKAYENGGITDAASNHARKEFPKLKEAAEQDPADREARDNLRKNAETAGRVLEELMNKSPEERKRREGEIDEIHGIIEHWEQWRIKHPQK